jgi:nifR3 family TIM-barrel protein
MSLLRSVRIGTAVVPGNIFLAPLAGFTDSAFRGICVGFGAFMTYSEMLSAEGFIRDNKKTADLLKRDAAERFFGVQIFTGSPYSAARAVEDIGALDPTLIDLNCGCPVPKVIRTGSGAALLRNPRLIYDVVKAMKENSKVPVTVKIRSGWDGGSINYRESADAAASAGADMICLHPRTRAQGYSGNASWDHIKDLKTRCPVPVFGSGDLFSPEAAVKMLGETGCDGLMFARGALGNPFIFRETLDFLAKGEYDSPSTRMRINTALEHLERSVQLKGEAFACREMRKHFCAYIKGVPGSARFRNQVVHAETLGDYRTLSEAFLEGQEEDGPA